MKLMPPRNSARSVSPFCATEPEHGPTMSLSARYWRFIPTSPAVIYLTPPQPVARIMDYRDFADPREATMHFCFTANYTPETLKAMAKNPGASRRAAIQKLADAAGAKLVCMFYTIAEGPGAIAIFD